MRKFGCSIALVLILVLVGEGYVYHLLARAMHEYLGVALAAAALSFAGYRILRWRAARMPMMMLGGDPGRAFVGMFGAFLLVVPGFVTGAVGLILQLPFVARLFARPAKAVMVRMARSMTAQMGQGMTGVGNPFASGMPGPFPFAASGLRPDDSRPFKGKTVETTVEKE